MKTLITFNTFFGATVLLLFFWRRLTSKAILISCVIWIVLIGVLPIAVPMVDSLRRHPALLLETQPRVVGVSVGTHTIPAMACFWDKVARVDPKQPELGSEGIGRFLTENYVLSLVGVPVQRLSPAGLVTARWLFDAVFPFVMLIGFSLITPGSEPERAERFYATMKTPVASTPELDQTEVARSYAAPTRFDREKLFPGTNWEFTRWTKADFLGFFGCWGIVGLILLLLFGVLRVGA